MFIALASKHEGVLGFFSHVVNYLPKDQAVRKGYMISLLRKRDERRGGHGLTKK